MELRLYNQLLTVLNFQAVKEKTDLGGETNIILDFLIRFWTVSVINQIKNKRESGVVGEELDMSPDCTA